MIEFTVHGKPIAQPRHRVAVVGGTGRAYLPAKHPVHAWKQAVELAARRAMAGALIHEPMTGPVAVYLRFFFERPKSQQRKTIDQPMEWHTKKPDADNLAKAVLDGLNGVLWDDDAQVVHLSVTKRITANGDPSHMMVEVSKRQEI